jgi:hypothetical protein
VGSAHPTLAEHDLSSVNIVGANFDATIGHDSIPQQSTLQRTKIYQSLSPSKISIRQVGELQSGSIQISASQASGIQIGITQIGETQIGVAEVDSSQVSSPQIGITQVSSRQTSSREVSSKKTGITQISTSEISAIQIGTTQINTSQITSSQWNPLRFTNSQVNTSEIPLTNSITLQQFLSSHNFNLQNTTIPTWTEFLTGTTSFNLNIEITDLPTGQLAEANITHFDPTGRPTSGTLTLGTNANGLGWFIDSTPWDNAEFGTLNSETFFRATLGSAAYGHYDLLTTILHELGHLAGLISGNSTYDSRITNISGTPTFQGNGYSAPLTQDRSHLADPTKLMGTYLAPGMRKLPSQLELQMLADLRSTPPTAASTSPIASSAHQDATPMLGITNGQFDQLLTQWETRGSIQVTNAAVTLREDDPLLANLSQTFIIPNGAKTFQFTLRTIGPTPSASPILGQSRSITFAGLTERLWAMPTLLRAPS